MKRCKICLRNTGDSEDLCSEHRAMYKYDSKLKGYRLKKANNGSFTRYIKGRYHSHEIELTKILEKYYGVSNVVTGFHPLWAISKKGALLEYDIYITNKNILIEYNGRQHYKFTKIFHKTLKKFREQKKRDKHKVALAKAHGYKFTVIKYDEPLIEDYIISKLGELENV